ncbi:hypothetical protein IWW47_003907, partial [Coemansia sp. RSA 2052]
MPTPLFAPSVATLAPLFAPSVATRSTVLPLLSLTAPRTLIPSSGASAADWVPLGGAGDMSEFATHRFGDDMAPPAASHNRPEVGETPTTTTAEAMATATEASENFAIHGATGGANGGGEPAIGGFSDTADEWGRLLQPTKTAGLPELLDKPHAPPDFMPLPTEVNARHFDPEPAVAIVDSYAAAEFNPLATGDAPDKIAEDVWRVVESLTLEEKAGQMQQIHVGQLLDARGRLNESAVAYWIGEKKVGSVVDSPGNSARAAFAWYAAPTLANLTNAVQQVALAQGSRVPLLWGLDSVRGASFVKHAAMFPAAIGVAATFAPRFAFDAGRVAAKDSRAAGYAWAFAPSADLGADKRAAHAFLGFGEDPALLSAMVRAAVGGLQGEYKTDRGRVAACVTNFVSSLKAVPDSLLFEYHLPGFEAAIAAGASSIMQSVGSVNGEAVAASGFYLRRVLRDRLGFRGVMIADHEQMLNTRGVPVVAAANATDAAYLALNNTSVDMTAGDPAFSHMATELVRAGSVAEDRITESTARIIQLKKDLGLFDTPFAERVRAESVGSAQDVEMARATVRESITLLKNVGGVLPLAKTDRVLFVGPHMNSTALLGGGWNVHRKGPTAAEGDAVYEGFGDSVIAGVRAVTGREPVYHPGFRLDGVEVNLEGLLRVARQADKIVVAL